MVQSPFCSKCLSGSLHTGTPLGSVSAVAGIETYVAPAPSAVSGSTIVLITDVFGYELPNVRLLADEYSRAGYNAVVPDIFHGDNMAFDALDSAANLDELFGILGPWLKNHGSETVTPVLDAVLDKLRRDGQKIGVVGFCFGGKYAFHYAATDKVDAVCAMHPSLIDLPNDAQAVKKPISIHVASTDEIYNAEKSKQAAQIFEKNKVPYENRIYDGEGVGHGFAVRGDLTKSSPKAAKEEAIAASIAWYQKFL